MTRNENRLFGRHFETVQIFYFFFWNMVVISVYTYGVKIIKKIPVGKWFSLGGGGVPWNPRYALTEVRGTLCSFKSVNAFLPKMRHLWAAQDERKRKLGKKHKNWLIGYRENLRASLHKIGLNQIWLPLPWQQYMQCIFFHSGMWSSIKYHHPTNFWSLWINPFSSSMSPPNGLAHDCQKWKGTFFYMSLL